jgi:hypothetical protein
MSGDSLYNFLFILIYFPAVFIIYELSNYCCKNVISRVVVVVLLGSNKQVSTPKSSLLSQFRYKQVKTVKLDLDFEILFLAVFSLAVTVTDLWAIPKHFDFCA